MTVSQIQILAAYNQQLDAGKLQQDRAQFQAVNALQQLAETLSRKSSWWQTKPQYKGIFLYGPVGRGKSMLMDLFYQQLPTEKKQRLHFHHFMAQVHSQLNSLQGSKNPLSIIAKRWAKSIRVLCFDEFFVSDIGDAMIMSGLFEALFSHGVVLVATSNCHPQQLYFNGLQRARFLPCIALLESHCHIINVAGECDHRFRFGRQLNHFICPHDLPKSIDDFKVFSGKNSIVENQTLTILGRPVSYLMRSDHAVMFDFMALCSGTRSTYDYIKLANSYSRVYVVNIPAMGQGMTSKRIVHGIEDSYQREHQAHNDYYLDDEARRFIALVDECYDRGTLLVLSAHVQIEQLYEGQKLAFEFARTTSRLVEMQYWQ